MGHKELKVQGENMKLIRLTETVERKTIFLNCEHIAYVTEEKGKASVGMICGSEFDVNERAVDVLHKIATWEKISEKKDEIASMRARLNTMPYELVCGHTGASIANGIKNAENKIEKLKDELTGELFDDLTPE